MSKGRFLNQKLGKRTTRKIALLKSRIQKPGFRIQNPGFRSQGNIRTASKPKEG